MFIKQKDDEEENTNRRRRRNNTDVNKQKGSDDDDKPNRRRRRVMNKVRIDELSAVDRPAQEGAVATIMKRAPSESDTVVEKNGDLVDMLTSVEDGHQHGVNVRVYDDGVYLSVSYAKAEGADFGHDHMVVRTEGNEYEVSMVDGHTHTLDSARLQMIVSDRMFNKASNGEELELEFVPTEKGLLVKPISKSNENLEEDMPGSNSATVALEKKVSTLESQLATATALAGMNDTQKSYYNGLDDIGKSDFVTKSMTQRDEAVELHKAADAVVYTSVTDGSVFRKSDDPRLVQMAKQHDLTHQAMTKSLEDNANMALEKRASVEMQYMAGTTETHVAILKALDGIEDEGIRKSAYESLKAKNDSMAGVFKNVGSSFVKNEAGTDGNAEEELESLAKAYVADKGGNYTDAYAVVSEQNPDLYARAVNGQ